MLIQAMPVIRTSSAMQPGGWTACSAGLGSVPAVSYYIGGPNMRGSVLQGTVPSGGCAEVPLESFDPPFSVTMGLATTFGASAVASGIAAPGAIVTYGLIGGEIQIGAFLIVRTPGP